MIAFAKRTRFTAKPKTATPAWHEGFLKLLPAIRHHARICFRHLAPEAKEEAVQECVVHATMAYARLADLGKEDVAYAGPLATYAVKRYHVGRRVNGQNVRDVMSELCQRQKGVIVQRLDHYDETEGEWQELIVEDRNATPADIAATKIDFQNWLLTLPRRLRRLALKLAAGETTGSVARLFKITAGRVSQLRRELLERWEAFQGEAGLAAA